MCIGNGFGEHSSLQADHMTQLAYRKDIISHLHVTENKTSSALTRIRGACVHLAYTVHEDLAYSLQSREQYSSQNDELYLLRDIISLQSPLRLSSAGVPYLCLLLDTFMHVRLMTMAT